MNTKLEEMVKYCSWLLMIVITAVCAFFVVHNAQWVIGDDAIVMAFSGWGHWFPMSHTVNPENGRFFPTSYQMYNLFAPFFDGQMSAHAMYGYHAVVFAFAVIICFYLVLEIMKNRALEWRYGVALLASVFFIGRNYPSFMNCFTTAWFGTFLTMAMLLSAYLFYTRKCKWYGIITLLIVIWITYTGENAFVAPLAWGTCGILLLWKKSTRWERIFHIGLVADAIIFLLVYFLFIYLHTDKVYDSSHGSGVTFVRNMINILVAQKFLWIAFIVLCARVWDVLKNKAEILFYDLFLLTAGAVCVGGFILKLNWVLYYNGAVLMCLPAVVYYLNVYMKPYWAALVMFLFAGWYGLKVPKTIKECDRDRQDCHRFMSVVAEQVEKGNTVYLYMPGDEVDTVDGEARRWLFAATETFTRYYTNNKELKLEKVKIYDGRPGVYITIDKNESLSIEGNKPIESVGIKIAHNEMRQLDAWIVE